MSGSYITHDGGPTWRMFNLRGVVDFFAFDPKDPNTMYAHATGLWRSTDGGEHWNLVYPDPSAVKGVKMASDHSDEEIVADPDPLVSISAFAIDPRTIRKSCLRGGWIEDKLLRCSSRRTRGSCGRKLTDLPDSPRRIWIDPKSPSWVADDLLSAKRR